MRWDLDGDGDPVAGNATDYRNAFSGAFTGMGCPDGGDADQLPDACAGYELTQDLDFDTDGLEATVRFEVRVEFFWPSRLSAGWRAVTSALSASK